jgi:hypothetical protein
MSLKSATERGIPATRLNLAAGIATGLTNEMPETAEVGYPAAFSASLVTRVEPIGRLQMACSGHIATMLA